MKKILLSILTIGLVGTLAYVGFSRAFFTDTETSNGNTFTAGAIDLRVDSQCTYNGQTSDQCGNWQLKDLEPASDKFFNFTDIKPGDWGENTISLHVYNNDAWACLKIQNLQNNENGETEPEALADTTEDTGDLAQNIYFTAWADDGDNKWESGEPLLFTNDLGPASDVLNGRTYALADATTQTGPLPGGEWEDTAKTRYIGLQWCFGNMVIDETNHTITCDGSTEGNETQTDSLTADISFEVVQARNNPAFTCSGDQVPTVRKTLVLENEDMTTTPTWTPIADGISGLLTWDGDGPTFNYTVTAQGLPANTNYSLIYYADPYPGNNPGKLIGTGTTDGSGNLAFSGNPDLNMDLPMLPDANYATGAKIWLIPSANYDSGTNSVNPWNPDNTTWLFEGNIYIKYNDTDI